MDTMKKTARLAGFLFLFYIAVGLLSIFIFNYITNGAGGTAAKLAGIARHASLMRLNALLGLLSFFIAVTLAIALYILTRDQNSLIAKLALGCRAAEGMINAISAIGTMGLLSLAVASTAAVAPESSSVQTLGNLLLQQDNSSLFISSTCFAVGSFLYSYLFLRAQSIPEILAWLGIVASVLLVVALPMQMLGALSGPLVSFIWLPMLVFELVLGLWLIIRGVKIPATA